MSQYTSEPWPIGIPISQHSTLRNQEINHGEVQQMQNRRNFEDELVCLINKYSKENGSSTPDFILANFLIRCLGVFDETIIERSDWYGRVAGGGLERPKADEARTESNVS